MPMMAATDCDVLVQGDEFAPDAYPLDLADWISPSKLQSLALRLAQRESNRVEPVFSFGDRRMSNPWRVLALWLYCAGRGVCSPAALRDFAVRDSHARQLCNANPPSIEVIGRFREQNLRILLFRLEELLATSCLHTEHGTPFARCFELYVTGKARAEAERRLRAGYG